MDELSQLLNSIPKEWTAYEIRSRQGRTAFICDLTREDGRGDEDHVWGHGDTVEQAVRDAISKLPV